MAKVAELEVVTLFVEDVDAAKAFYVDVLGTEVIFGDGLADRALAHFSRADPGHFSRAFKARGGIGVIACVSDATPRPV